jgi:hypothetical protein
MKIMSTWIACLFLGAVAYAQTCSECRSVATWTYAGSPADVDIPTLAAMRTNPSAVVVLEKRPGLPMRYGVIRGKSGVQWTAPRNVSGSVRPEQVLAVSGSSQASTLYGLRAEGRDLIRSKDGGRSWTAAAVRIDNKPRSEFVEEGDGRPGAYLKVEIVGIGSHGSVLVAQLSSSVPSVRGGPPSDRVRQFEGTYISYDYGDVWSLLTKALRPGSPVGVDNKNPRAMMGIAAQGLVKSSDGGRTWASVAQQGLLNTPLEIAGRREKLEPLRKNGQAIPDEFLTGRKSEIYQIEYSPSEENTVLLRSNRGVLQSRDGGETWCLLEAGSEMIDQVDSLVVSLGRSELYITTTVTTHSPAQLLRSDDGGCTFHVILDVRAK